MKSANFPERKNNRRKKVLVYLKTLLSKPESKEGIKEKIKEQIERLESIIIADPRKIKSKKNRINKANRPKGNKEK